MRTRISGVSVALAAAGILCLGSNLPAVYGQGGKGGGGGRQGGGGGGGARMGGGGGGFSGGGGARTGGGGGGFSGGGGARTGGGGGGFSGGGGRTGGGGGGFNGGAGGRTSGGGGNFGGGGSRSSYGAGQGSSAPPRSFNTPSQSFGGQGGASTRQSPSLGSTTQPSRQFNGGMNNGGVRSGGGNSSDRVPRQSTAQPSFSNRHAGSNLAGDKGASSSRGNGGGASISGNGRGGAGSQMAAGNRAGQSGVSSPSRHVIGNSGDSTNSFANRHAAHVANSGTAGGSRGGAQQAQHLKNAGSGAGSGRGQGQGQGPSKSQSSAQGPGRGSGQGGNFAARHDGRNGGVSGGQGGQQGPSRVADRSGGPNGGTIPNGAVGANRTGGGRGHSVNAHQMWNNVGRGVGTGLASFHGHHHRVNNVGGVHGNNFARGGYRHGYYGNNFRHNRVWFGVGSGFWPYYAWNYRPFWGGGWGGGYRYGWGWGRPWRFGLGWGYPLFGLGYGWGGGYGLGGYGYGGYGYGDGFGGYGYNSCCMYTPGYSTYSNGYSYAPSSYYGNSPASTAYSVDNTPPAEEPVQLAQADPSLATVRAQTPDSDLDFGAAGEAEFKGGNYEKAVKNWRHAVLDDPKNGVLVMMLSQGLFASGKFDEAAGATQQGMLLLKEEDWGVVIANYRELYAKVGDYTTQLRALEKARKDKPEDPALRFLLGFHYAYLGFPNEAVKELDKAIALAPQDELAGRLKEVLDAKLKKASGNSKSAVKDSVPVPPVPILKKDD